MSLLCQHCKESKATVHITDTVPNQRERHLCEACAEKEGVIQKHLPHTTNQILQQLFKHRTGVEKNAVCEHCGMTLREFHAKGLLGCPNDYLAFKKFLAPLIERTHEGASHHVGKVPASAGAAAKRQTGLVRLRRELQEAIDLEHYEQAASVRDKIRMLESPNN